MSSANFSGALFDGRAEHLLEEGGVASRHKVAQRGQELVRAAFDGAIRVNEGRFVGSVTVIESSTSFNDGGYTMSVAVPQKTSVVTTSTASYGPWLDGEGSRNASSRFKGYHGFRQAAGELEAQAQSLAEAALAPWVERMNA